MQPLSWRTLTPTASLIVEDSSSSETPVCTESRWTWLGPMQITDQSFWNEGYCALIEEVVCSPTKIFAGVLCEITECLIDFSFSNSEDPVTGSQTTEDLTTIDVRFSIEANEEQGLLSYLMQDDECGQCIFCPTILRRRCRPLLVFGGSGCRFPWVCCEQSMASVQGTPKTFEKNVLTELNWYFSRWSLSWRRTPDSAICMVNRLGAETGRGIATLNRLGPVHSEYERQRTRLSSWTVGQTCRIWGYRWLSRISFVVSWTRHHAWSQANLFSWISHREPLGILNPPQPRIGNTVSVSTKNCPVGKNIEAVLCSLQKEIDKSIEEKLGNIHYGILLKS